MTVALITETATEQRRSSIYGVDMPDKGTIHVLGGVQQDCTIFHHATQKSAKFKTYKLFISGIFHLIFSDHS